MVSASSRCAIRCASPAGVLARCCSSRIWPLRLLMVDSITSRRPARRRSRARLSAVRTRSGVRMANVLQGECLAVLAAPQAFVRDQRASRMGGGQLTHRLVLLFVGRDERVPERHSVAVGHQDETHPPHVLALGGAVAVGGSAREFAAALAASVVGNPEQGAVRDPQTTLRDQLRDPQLHGRERRREPTQTPVVLRLLGQVGKPAGQHLADKTEELPIRRDPHRRLRHRQRDQLRIGHLPARAAARDRRTIREHVRSDNKGLQRCCHLVLQSRGNRAGGPFFVDPTGPCS